MRKLCIQWVALAAMTGLTAGAGACTGPEILKPRLVVLTDVAPGSVEPDDMESMVRLMVHADLYEIEALIASGGWNSSAGPYPPAWADSLTVAIGAYERDLPNLARRSCQSGFLALDEESARQKIGYWPSADYLRSRVTLGSPELGIAKIGPENRSPGSDLIIRLADENDPRPLWITVWGGGNTLAQAIWQVEQERTEEELKAFLGKLRVYTITDQDMPFGLRHTDYAYSSHQWMRREFEKDLLFIWDESAWLSQLSLGGADWEQYVTHIQGHGALGRIYPDYKYGVEGDTPSFLHLMPNGLNDPSEPGQTGWGGYFEWGLGMDGETFCRTNHEGHAREISQRYEHYFYPATFNNFAARMDWAAEGKGNRNPEVVVDDNAGIDIIHMSVKPGQKVKPDASRSHDPDGDALSFKWWAMPTAGSYNGLVEIENASSPRASVSIPADAAASTIHLICEVTDDGSPRLVSYRRIILQID